MRRDIRARAAEVFGKYVVFSKAEFDAQNDDWQCFAFWGSEVAEAIQAAFGCCPREHLERLSGDGFVLVQTDADHQRFECYLRVGTEYHNAFTQSMQEGDESTWRRYEIQSGVVRIEASTQEAFVPQVVNYDLTGHISFTKGCYTGQEVVARLHYRGTSKRRTYLAQLPEAARAGDSVFVMDTEQSVGDIVNVENGESSLALVSATRTGAEQGLHLHAPDGPLITLQPLPYPLDDDKT